MISRRKALRTGAGLGRRFDTRCAIDPSRPDQDAQDHDLGRQVGRHHEGHGAAGLREGVQVHGVGRPGLPVHAQAAGQPAERSAVRRLPHQFERAVERAHRRAGDAQDHRQGSAQRRRRLSLCGERQDRRRDDLHQRDRARLPHRQGPHQAQLVEGPRRSQARRRARRLHHSGEQPRPGASHDAGQGLRQGPHRSRRRLQGAGAAEAHQARRFHRPDGKDAAVGRGLRRRDPRFGRLSL